MSSEVGTAGRATPDVILEAADRLYARFGPRKTTMGEIANEAGCSRATLYLYFPSKDALYAGLLERETRAFLEEVEATVASARGARQKLRRIVEATIRIYANSPTLRRALAGDDGAALERVAQPTIEASEKRVIARLRTVLEEGIEEGVFRAIDTEASAYLMYELGRVLVLREVSGQADFPLDRILTTMDDLVSRGIARAPNGRRAAPGGARKEKRR